MQYYKFYKLIIVINFVADNIERESSKCTSSSRKRTSTHDIGELVGIGNGAGVSKGRWFPASVRQCTVCGIRGAKKKLVKLIENCSWRRGFRPDICQPSIRYLQSGPCDDSATTQHVSLPCCPTSATHELRKEGQDKSGGVSQGWKWDRERKRDSLLIRTRHSLGTVVADHRRRRRCHCRRQCVSPVLRGCWQAQAHAKAPSVAGLDRDDRWRGTEWPRYAIDV